MASSDFPKQRAEIYDRRELHSPTTISDYSYKPSSPSLRPCDQVDVSVPPSYHALCPRSPHQRRAPSQQPRIADTYVSSSSRQDVERRAPLRRRKWCGRPLCGLVCILVMGAFALTILGVVGCALEFHRRAKVKHHEGASYVGSGDENGFEQSSNLARRDYKAAIGLEWGPASSMSGLTTETSATPTSLLSVTRSTPQPTPSPYLTPDELRDFLTDPLVWLNSGPRLVANRQKGSSIDRLRNHFNHGEVCSMAWIRKTAGSNHINEVEVEEWCKTYDAIQKRKDERNHSAHLAPEETTGLLDHPSTEHGSEPSLFAEYHTRRMKRGDTHDEICRKAWKSMRGTDEEIPSDFSNFCTDAFVECIKTCKKTQNWCSCEPNRARKPKDPESDRTEW